MFPRIFQETVATFLAKKSGIAVGGVVIILQLWMKGGKHE